jgi:hypothetical protein
MLLQSIVYSTKPLFSTAVFIYPQTHTSIDQITSREDIHLQVKTMSSPTSSSSFSSNTASVVSTHPNLNMLIPPILPRADASDIVADPPKQNFVETPAGIFLITLAIAAIAVIFLALYFPVKKIMRDSPYALTRYRQKARDDVDLEIGQVQVSDSSRDVMDRHPGDVSAADSVPRPYTYGVDGTPSEAWHQGLPTVREYVQVKGHFGWERQYPEHVYRVTTSSSRLEPVVSHHVCSQRVGGSSESMSTDDSGPANTVRTGRSMGVTVLQHGVAGPVGSLVRNVGTQDLVAPENSRLEPVVSQHVCSQRVGGSSESISTDASGPTSTVRSVGVTVLQHGVAGPVGSLVRTVDMEEPPQADIADSRVFEVEDADEASNYGGDSDQESAATDTVDVGEFFEIAQR